MYSLSILTVFETQFGCRAEVNAIFETLEDAIWHTKPFIDNGFKITIEKIEEDEESEAE